MCACGCDATRNITKRQLSLLRQQTLFFAYPMAGLMMKRIGCGTKPVRQLAMPNAVWATCSPFLLERCSTRDEGRRHRQDAATWSSVHG